MLWSSLLVLGLVQLGTSKGLLKRWDDLAVKHSWAKIPPGWEHHAPAPPDYVLDLRIGLKQDRVDDLIDNLLQISDPTNTRYGQHLTKDEAQTFVAPHPDSVEAVDSWLQFHGIDPQNSVHRSGGGDWLTLHVPVDLAEQMLGTKYNVYRHTISGEEVVRTLSYSLPEGLYKHIDVVVPTTNFVTLRSMKVTSFVKNIDLSSVQIQDTTTSSVPEGVVDPSCNTTITPACLRALYNTSSYKPVSTKDNKLAVVGYLDEFVNYADLQTFFKQYRPDATGSNITVVKVNKGGDDQSKPGVEANLDIQYTIGTTFPTPNIYYSTGGQPPFKPDANTPNNTNEPYLDFLNYYLGLDSVAQVVSTSYGDDEQTVPPDYAKKVCDMLAQLGSRGATVFFSSGDSGVGGGNCTSNDGTSKVVFQPSFPASCPWVTTVGGTTHIPEVAVNFTGGGFSRLFPTPDYQKATVSKYVQGLGSKYAGLYNPNGRAYPDVSAQGDNYQVIVGNKTMSTGGTSASCPTVASVFSLLNDYRLSKGLSSLGFINPLIYSTASSGFNDIVSGSNPGCGTDGFSAGPGWDPTTGLGTPNFLKLQELLGTVDIPKNKADSPKK